MRALLVVNPKATATTARTRDVLAQALGSEAKVDVAETARRGHAIELAAEGRADGMDLVVALGGDGTVNEVVNGLLARGPGDDVPRLAVVPAGSANVFARTVGLPDEPVEATALILEALRAGQTRLVGLGTVEGAGAAPVEPVHDEPATPAVTPEPLARRWFTFCAGVGLDAEAVARVEARRTAGRRATPGLYVRSALAQYFWHTDRRTPALTLAWDDQPPVEGTFFAIVSNTAPWTYWGRRPVNPSPRASFGTGLDLFGLRGMHTAPNLRTLTQMFVGSRGPHGRKVVAEHDLARLTVRASRPVALQVDGDYLGEHREVVLHSVPRALHVVVPPPAMAP